MSFPEVFRIIEEQEIAENQSPQEIRMRCIESAAKAIWQAHGRNDQRRSRGG